jgi:hypothetical protein
MSAQDALYLFSASHYFQFSNSRLQVFCKRNLETNVSKDNVFEVCDITKILSIAFLNFYFFVDSSSSG